MEGRVRTHDKPREATQEKYVIHVDDQEECTSCKLHETLQKRKANYGDRAHTRRDGDQINQLKL